MPRRKYPHRSKRKMTYHNRTGKPMIHLSKSGRTYIMVRHPSGKGVKRLYMDSKKFKKEVTVHRK